MNLHLKLKLIPRLYSDIISTQLILDGLFVILGYSDFSLTLAKHGLMFGMVITIKKVEVFPALRHD